MVNYSAGSASITVLPSFDRFKIDAENKLKAMKLGPLDVRLELNTEAAKNKIKALRTIAANDLKMRLDLDTRAARTKIKALAAGDVRMRVELNTDAAKTKVRALRAEASRNVSGMRVDVNTAAALLEIEALRRAAGEPIPVPVEPETDTEDAEKKVTKSHDALGRKLKRKLKWAAIYNISVVGVIGAASVLGDLAAITNAAAKAAHTIALLPAIGFGGLVGIGSLAAGLSGLPAAFKAKAAVTKHDDQNDEQHRKAIAGVADAEYALQEAQRGVQDSSRVYRQSQQSLIEVYKDESRAIRDMNNDLADTKLSVEDAALSVQEAAQRLNQVRFDPTANATERARADLTYREALQRLSEQQNKVADLQADTATANAKGIEGSKQVLDAKQAVTDAAHGEATAAHDLSSAYEGLRAAQHALSDPTGSQANLDAALEKLSPKARQLVDDINKIGPAWTEARKAAQDALTDGIGPPLAVLAKEQLPALRDGMVKIDTAFNGGFKDMLKELSNTKNQTDFKTSLDNTAKGFENAAKGAGPLTDAVTQLITVGSSFLPQFGTALANAAQKFADLISLSAADGSLQQYMQSGIDAATNLFQILGHIGSSIASVFRAASAGGPTLKSIEELTGRMSAFLKSVDGQNGMKNFWAEARAGADGLKPVFKDLPAILHNIWEGIRDWSAILLPFLRFAANLLSGHITTVKLLVIGWLAFKTISPILALVSGGLGRANTQLGNFRSTFAGAGGGIRGFASGLGGLTSLLGGPWGLAMIGATALIIGMTNEYQKSQIQADTLAKKNSDLAKHQRELAKDFQSTNGEVSSEIMGKLETQIDEAIATTEKLAGTKPGAFSVFTGGVADIKGWFSGHAQAGTDAVRAADAVAASNTATRDSFRELGQSSAEMTQELYGSNAAFDAYLDKLHATKNGGKDAEGVVRELRQSFLDAREVARNTTPGFFGLSDAIGVLSDKTKSATDRLGALRSALDILSGKPVDAQKALADYNQTIRDAADLAKDLDRGKGFGAALRLDNGDVDTTTENGKKLLDAILAIKDSTLAAGVAGKDLDPIFAKNDQSLATLAQTFGLTTDQVKQMATNLGYLPTDIKMLVSLPGADDAAQQLVTIADLLTRNKQGIVIPLSTLNKDAKDKLKEVGALEEVVGHPELIKIVANGDQALGVIQQIAQTAIADKTVKVKLEYDLSGFHLSQSDKEKIHEDISKVAIAPGLPKAAGGEISGGVRGKDSVPITAMPGEHVLTTADVDAMGGQAQVYRWRAGLHAGEGFEIGGAVGSDLAARAHALDYYARSRDGEPYSQTGYGDCSGFISALANVAIGREPTAGRMSTATEGPWLTALGFQPGAGAPGSFQVGWTNDASMAAGGHTAGTLPSGVNVESGGATSEIMYGPPAIGAGAALFREHAYLPMGGTGASTGTGNASTLSTQSQLNPQAPLPGRATDQQLQALSGRAAVDSANSERNAVYANPASTAQDKQAADIKYLQAQNSLESSQKDDSSSLSLQSIFSKAGGILATGLLSAFGLEDSIFSESNVYNKSASTLFNRFGPQGAGGYAYQPQNLPSIASTSTPQSAAGVDNPYLAGAIPGAGPLTGFGDTDLGTVNVLVPGSPKPGGNAGSERWRPLAAQALIREGFDPAQVDYMVSQIQSESGGDPNAVQQVIDVNSGGNEAVGLLQVTPGTFAQYRDRSLPDDRKVPSANMIAALRYYRARYGNDLSTVWGQGHGYADGGWVFGPGGSRSDSIHARVSPGEYIINAAAAAQHAPILEAINSSSWSPSRVDTGSMNTRSTGPAAGHNFSTTIVEPRVADVGDLVALAERAAQTKAIGLMAAMR